MNPVVTKPFDSSALNGSGIVQINLLNATLDPTLSSFVGNPSQNGADGFKEVPLWTGRGVGGGGLHFLLEYVRPTQTILDGPLPPSMIPPSNTSTFAFAQAGGPAWSNAVIQNLIKNQIENYIGTSQTPAERGENGPETITQNQNGSPQETALLNAMSAATISNLGGIGPVPGGALSPVVPDYNVSNTYNCVSQPQNFITPFPDATRQNSQTSWANSTIVAPDGRGNLVGVNGRKLVIWTNRLVTKTVKSSRKSRKLGQFVADGVEFLQNNEVFFIKSKNVISSMGAGNSPLFWQRSGIGNSTALAKAGIPTQVSSPFIGQNLQNQYGPILVISTTDPALGSAQGLAFVQYNNTPRRWQQIFLSVGPNPVGIIVPIAFPNAPAGTTYCYMPGFILEPRSRGFLNVTQTRYWSTT